MADPRVASLVILARSLAADNAAALSDCKRIAPPGPDRGTARPFRTVIRNRRAGHDLRGDGLGEGDRGAVMTTGGSSRRTGVAVKTLRAYEDAGLIYTIGRSAGNYRLFAGEAVACVRMVETLRSLA